MKRLLILCLLLLSSVAWSQPLRPAKGYAVLVGVKETTAKSARGISFAAGATLGAVTDVSEVANRLLLGGFDPVNIRQLNTSETTKADSILYALRSLKKVVEPGDLVVFYFSGHGDQYPDNLFDRDETDTLDEGLIASDRAILDDMLKPIWESYGKEVRIVMIADACHSGTMSAFVDFTRNRRPDIFGASLTNASRTIRSDKSKTRPADKQKEESESKKVSNERFAKILVPGQSQKTILRSDTIDLKSEYRFLLSLQRTEECFEEGESKTEPYQMIYIGACSDKQAQLVPNGITFSPFTSDLITQLNNVPAGGGYKYLCQLARRCPSILTYAELGPVSESFKKGSPFVLNQP